MMEENNGIFLAGVETFGPMQKKYFTTFVWGHPFSVYVCQDQFFNPLPPCKHMYAFRVTVTAVGLFQKILLNTRTYILNNMTQMLQVNKNSDIKYNIIQVKLK